MNFHVYQHKKTGRTVIGATAPAAFEIKETVQAFCWLDAKKKFGEELTPLQERMLDAKRNSHKAGRRTERHEQDAGSIVRTSDRTLHYGGEAGEDSEFNMQQVLREEGLLLDLCSLGGSGSTETISFAE